MKKIKKILIILSLLTLTIIFTSCENKIDYTYELTKEQMLEDYDELWQVLEDNYLYFDVLKSMGINVGSLKEVYRGQIENVEKFEDFYFLLCDLLAIGLHQEGHLNMVYAEQYKPVAENIEKTLLENIPKDTERYLKDTVLNENTKKRYKDLEEKISTYNSYAASDIVEMEIIKEEAYKTLILDLNTFVIEDLDKNKKLIQDALLERPYENIIIDLRNNYGGDLNGWYNIVKLLIDQDIDMKINYLAKGKIAEYIYDSYDSHFEKNILPSQKGEELNVYTFDFHLDSEKEINYDPKIYLLLNDQSLSASIMFAQFAKDTGFGKVVSRSPISRGNGSFSQGHGLNAYRLKNSNLLFQFFTGRRCDEDGNLSNIIIEPDIILREDDDYKKILRTIR